MYSKAWFDWFTDVSDYWLDSLQRSILFMDVMRKRGNRYLDHLHEGQPPVLVFEYDSVLDGRTLERPVNYCLVRIRDRRDTSKPDRRHLEASPPEIDDQDRRGTEPRERHKPLVALEAPSAVSRPIVVFDPRAGHGPGIGGSKKDSQIGMALDAGHPVYFLIFSTYPVPGQTLADVRNAQIIFLEKVRDLHPGLREPAIIGNCQGGWAAALVGAERPDLVGPMAFNGSPLSYWAGVEGVNPLRYLGGLVGGTWLASWLSDLGGGFFDGANLVANFENLNPANTMWTKQYNLYAKVDTEAERYLNFERWWGGFFLLTTEEIHQIVDGLFIGNKLERGEFQLDDNRFVDLKHNRNPVVLFASFGDNITPPQQAFNWLIRAYGSVEEIERRGQVIAYIVHSNVGHLGIFVSAKIARREHRKIIASFDMLYHLAPGLYEMHIDEDPDEHDEYLFHYHKKSMADIVALGDKKEDDIAFQAVKKVSEQLDLYYRSMLSPWIRMTMTGPGAEVLRQLHPLRLQRIMFSDLNPWMSIYRFWAELIKSENRRYPADADNRFSVWEKTMSDAVAATLTGYQQQRDGVLDLLFKLLYSPPWTQLLPGAGEVSRLERQVEKPSLPRRIAQKRPIPLQMVKKERKDTHWQSRSGHSA